ncbi:MAG: transporter [Acidimicrobiaceae bacterium]|nr:transporter [Acidimicrobiaceae bacterium]
MLACRSSGVWHNERVPRVLLSIVSSAIETGRIRTNIPGRLDRLPWSHWHWKILIGLGTVWILDGLEVTVVGNVSTRLTQANSGIKITSGQVSGFAAAMYVAGACAGALFFGWLTDRFGRKRLFMVTLGVYLLATALSALSTRAWMFYVFRALTGFGIGGEYAAINSAIDELIPARHRGRIDIIVNGTFWLGAAAGALLTIPALNESILPADVGWRLCFGLGVVLGLVILLVRRNVPESPRWLFIHGREEEAEKLVADVERQVSEQTGKQLDTVDEHITIRQRRTIGFGVIFSTVTRLYPRRTVLGLALFIGQAFLYNAITFGFATILQNTFHTPSSSTGYYYAVIAAGNLLGPLLLSRFFDTIGRKPMIAGTYLLSGVLLLGTALAFRNGALSATTLTLCWVVVLFFASAGASSAYLTVSEVFPMETRALAIAFFYAVGTGIGGITGPLVFAKLDSTGSLSGTALAFMIGALLMIGGGIVEIFFGVRAEGQSLENLAKPLTTEDADGDSQDGLPGVQPAPAGALGA